MLIRPQIVLLREGTDTSQGTGQLLSNISACSIIVDTIKSTFGPRGRDKLIVDKSGKTTISNDGATIMKLLDVAHPAARALVDIARAQDAEVGDGTTSVVVLAGELLNMAKPFIEDGVSAQTIIQSYRKACALALKRIDEISIGLSASSSNKELREVLEKCAATSMNSKLISLQKDFFKKIVVDAVLTTEGSLNDRMIGVKKISGGALQDSLLVDGVAFEKTFSYAGFELQPKEFHNPKIISLNVELELKAERENAEVRIEKVEDYQKIVDAEWKILYDKLDLITATGASVVLSKLPIGDVATQYFAEKGIFCAGRVASDDLERTVQSVGGSIQSSVYDIKPEYLGTCGHFAERQVGDKRYNFFTGCPQAKSCTIIIRGGSEQFMAEVERSLHDEIMIVKRTLKHKNIVAGGGAVEMEIAKYLREQALMIPGKAQMLIAAFAKAFEVVPRQLCENAGFDCNDLMTQLRKAHATGKLWAGVNIATETVSDMMEEFVWEPALIKSNMISAACEAACMILSIDLTIRAPSAQDPSATDLGKMAARAGMRQ
jgi:T-complex protein 1 subunit eta